MSQRDGNRGSDRLRIGQVAGLRRLDWGPNWGSRQGSCGSRIERGRRSGIGVLDLKRRGIVGSNLGSGIVWVVARSRLRWRAVGRIVGWAGLLCWRRGALAMMIHRLIVFVCWRRRKRTGQIDCRPSMRQHVKIKDLLRKGRGERRSQRGKRGFERGREVNLQLDRRIRIWGCAKSRGCDAGVNLGQPRGAGSLQQTAASGFQCHAYRGHASTTWQRAFGQTQRRGGEQGECVAVGTRGPLVICFLFLVLMDGDGQVSSRSRCC